MTLWILYFLGQAIHVLLQADAVARAPNNPVKTRLEVFNIMWRNYLARWFVGTMLFWLFVLYPTAIPTMVEYFGWNVPASIALMFQQKMPPPIAGLVGYAMDSILGFLADRIKALRRDK